MNARGPGGSKKKEGNIHVSHAEYAGHADLGKMDPKTVQPTRKEKECKLNKQAVKE